MDSESELDQKYLEETLLLLSNWNSEIQMREEEITQLNKLIKATVSQIDAIIEELALLEKRHLTADTKEEQLIITANKDLSSRLAQASAEREPFKKQLAKHQATLDNVSRRKKYFSQKVPSTKVTKLIIAESDATISAQKLEIERLNQASQPLTDQVTQLQNELDSGTQKLLALRQKISQTISEVIRPCKKKLTQAMLDQESYHLELESVKRSLETAQMCKNILLNQQKVLEGFVAAPISEKTSFKSSIQTENQLNMTPLV